MLGVPYPYLQLGFTVNWIMLRLAGYLIDHSLSCCCRAYSCGLAWREQPSTYSYKKATYVLTRCYWTQRWTTDNKLCDIWVRMN